MNNVRKCTWVLQREGYGSILFIHTSVAKKDYTLKCQGQAYIFVGFHSTAIFYGWGKYQSLEQIIYRNLYINDEEVPLFNTKEKKTLRYNRALLLLPSSLFFTLSRWVNIIRISECLYSNDIWRVTKGSIYCFVDTITKPTTEIQRNP